MKISLLPLMVLVLVFSFASHAAEIKMYPIDKKGQIEPNAKVFSWDAAKCSQDADGKLSITVEGKDYKDGKIQLTLEEAKPYSDFEILITDEHKQGWKAEASESDCDFHLDNSVFEAGALKQVDVSFKCTTLVSANPQNKLFFKGYEVPQKNPISCAF